MNRKNQSSIKSFLARAALIALLTGVATVASAQSSNSAKKYVATKEIIFDKATQKLRKPTAEETQAMVSQISTLTNRPTNLTATTLPNGTKKVDLQGGFNGVLLGRDKADGTTEIRCVMTLEEAVAFLGLEEVR